MGAHPWVYAAKLPKNEITPILPQIFADMRYAGFDGIELMHTALRPDDAVERIAELSQQHRLPIIGASFYGDMWDRGEHQAILEEAELVDHRAWPSWAAARSVPRSAPAPQKKTPAAIDAQAELLRKIIALGKANGVVLNLHNHTYEVVDNLYDLSGTLRADSRRKAGARPELAGPRRRRSGGLHPPVRQTDRLLHLRDQKADGRWSEAMGEGVTDYVAIAQALQDIRFRATP